MKNTFPVCTGQKETAGQNKLPLEGGRGENKMNFNNKKTQKIISSVIIILLVLAMIIPTLLSFL